MKKVLAIMLCMVLVVLLAACGTDETALKARYDEGYGAGYTAGKEAGVKEGKESVKPVRTYARFSGAFTASVGVLTPDYFALPGNTVAVVHFFQDGPFLLRFREDMTGKLAEGEAYVFEFETFEVQIPDGEEHPDIKDYMNYISVTDFRLAEEGEMGLQSKMPDVEIVVK